MKADVLRIAVFQPIVEFLVVELYCAALGRVLPAFAAILIPASVLSKKSAILSMSAFFVRFDRVPNRVFGFSPNASGNR